MEIVKEFHYQFFWGAEAGAGAGAGAGRIISQKTTVIRWLILYNTTKLWSVICL